MKGKLIKKKAVGWTLAAAVALTPVMAWANVGKEGYYGHGHTGSGMGHWLLGPLMMIVVIATIVAIVVLVVRWMVVTAASGGTHGPNTKSPADILKER